MSQNKIPVLILRPEQGANETADRAASLGLPSVLDPLFVIVAKRWSPPAPDNFDGLMLTSANTLRFGGAGLAQYTGLPVLAVGEATAEAARRAGFSVAITGNSNGADLLAALPFDHYDRILRLTGKHHVMLPETRHEITSVQVYEAQNLPLGTKAQAALAQDNITLLHSPRAAHILREEMGRLDISQQYTHLAVLSDAVAAAAGSGWKSISVAAKPIDDALLSIAARLCSHP